MSADLLVRRAAQLYVDWLAIHPTHRERALVARHGATLERLRRMQSGTTICVPVPDGVEAKVWGRKRLPPSAVYANRLRCMVMGSRRTNLWDWRFHHTGSAVEVTKTGVWGEIDMELLTTQIRGQEARIEWQRTRKQRQHVTNQERRERQWLREAREMLTAIRRYEADGGESIRYVLRKQASIVHATSAT